MRRRRRTIARGEMAKGWTINFGIGKVSNRRERESVHQENYATRGRPLRMHTEKFAWTHQCIGTRHCQVSRIGFINRIADY